MPIDQGQVDDLAVRADGAFTARCGDTTLAARTIILATGILDKKPALVAHGDVREVIRYCPICDGYEATDAKVAVLGGADAAQKAAFLRTYTRDVAWFIDDSSDTCPASIHGIEAIGRATALEALPDGVIITTTDGRQHRADRVYPALGCTARSDLATGLGAECTDVGTLRVDNHQQTTVPGLYAVGDVVSDLHQLAVATGHAAVAATAVHNRLPRNPR
jgi:thioredoxin reductase (NADPH)